MADLIVEELYEAATEVFLDLDEPSPYEMCVAAWAFRHAGLVPAARDLFQRSADAGCGAALIALADLVVHEGDSAEEAVALSRRAVAAGVWGSASLHAHILRKHLKRPNDAESFALLAVDEGDATGHLELSFIHQERGEGLAALQHLADAAAEGFEVGAYRRAAALEAAEQYDEAEAAYLEAIREGSSGAANDLGMMLSGLPDRENDAEWALRHALEVDRDIDALNNLGRLLARDLHRSEEAEMLFRTAIEFGQPHADNNLANLLNDLGRPLDELEPHYQASMARMEPSGFNSYAVVLNRAGRVEEALELWERAIELGAPSAHRNLGIVLSRDPDRQTDAELHLRAAIDGKDSKAHWPLGSLLAKDSDRESEAIPHLRRAVEHGEPAAAWTLARVLERHSDLDGAEEAWQIAVDGGVAGAGRELGRFVGRHRGAEAADAVLVDLAARGLIEEGEALHVRGGLFFNGQPCVAADLWRRAVASGRTESMQNLGFALLNCGELDEAERCLRLAALAGSGQSWLGVAEVIEKRGGENADAGMLEVLALSAESISIGEAFKPWMAETLVRQAVLLNRAGRRDEAIERCALAIDQPLTPECRWRLADYLADGGLHRPALEQLEAAAGREDNPAFVAALEAARRRVRDEDAE